VLASSVNRLRLLSILLATCAHGPSPSDAPAVGSVETRWLSLVLAGQPVGRSHEEVAPLADRGFRTRVSWAVRMARLGTTVEMASDASFDEDDRGRLRAVRTEMTLSRQTTTSEVSFADGTATIRDTGGGRTHTRTIAVTDPLLGPEAIRRASARTLRAAGDSLDYHTWSPTLSAPHHVHCTADAVETRTIDGASTRLVRVVIAEGEGQRHTAWLDAGGREVQSETPLPFGTMVATQTRAEPSLTPGELGADVFARTLARSNVRLPRPRALDQLVVRVSLDAPAATLPQLESADERIVGRDARGTVIEIDRVHPRATGGPSPAPVAPELLGASQLVDPMDPAVRSIAAQAIAGATDPWDQAQRLTRWVTDHMTFDAGVAFAPAAEVARDRHGTCAAYAVLLASLLRAAGIPARVDMGVVYVDGVFAGHAWVEAHLRGQWVALDAAVPSDGPADAARIALARDALDNGPGAMLAAFGRVVGRARVQVLGYTAAGRSPVRVDEAAAPYRIDGRRYSNPGLGLSVTAPPGYRYTDVNAVWPDPTVLALEGPDGRLTVVEHMIPPGRDPALAEAQALDLTTAAACARRAIAGRSGCAVRGDGRTAIAFADPPSLYIVDAHGPHAQALFDAVAETLVFDDVRR
jgi:hypothetical protein